MKNHTPCSVARFLESRGMIEDALEVATDPDYRFELAIQLGKLEIAKVNGVNFFFFLGALYIFKIFAQTLFICCGWLAGWLLTLEEYLSCYTLNSCLWIEYVVLIVLHLWFSLQEIATVAQSESKWKQLGELALSTGMVAS